MLHNKRWNNIINKCLPKLGNIKDKNIKQKLFVLCEKALIETRNIRKFNRLFNLYKNLLSNSLKVDLLKEVAQKELRINRVKDAINHLKQAINIMPNNPSLIWLYTVSLDKAGNSALALKEANILANSKDSFWANVGSALVSDISFWQGPAGSLKSKYYSFK